jgi:uncharacterized protein DUF4268
LKKAEIEKSFGAALSWECLDDKRASRARYVLKQGGLTDKSNWPNIQNAMIDAMDRLAKALKAYLAQVGNQATGRSQRVILRFKGQ